MDLVRGGATMQFGIFTVGDVTTDPTTGKTPTEHERIKAMTTIAKHAEEVGLDVFATGEHHNKPFVPSSPTTMRSEEHTSELQSLMSISYDVFCLKKNKNKTTT